ncbi:hypothetical protein MKZ19_12455 [Shouchella clausii]|uniref:hypothetical protein n=1 Tax=Shouchella clausii TaxID=79880 RepID=UPI0031FE0EEB
MNPTLAVVLIFVFVIADFLWIDQDSKRWGWLKNWPKPAKIVLFSSFGIILFAFYVVVSFPLTR